VANPARLEEQVRTELVGSRRWPGHLAITHLALIATVGLVQPIAPGQSAGAQELRTPRTLSGVAFDSLRGIPLSGALITLEGTAHSAFTDSTGHFALPGVPAGRFQLSLHHESLDSIGLTAETRTIIVPDTGARVLIATPSFRTLWHRACDAPPPSRDSGFVTGVLWDARRRTPLAGASVEVRWTDVGVANNGRVQSVPYVGTATTGPDGRYAFCGIPNETVIEFVAHAGESRTERIQHALPAYGVTRRDLHLAAIEDRALRGTVTGIVRGPEGAPVANARLRVEGGREVTTAPDGRFTIPASPIGTHMLTIVALGAVPLAVAVDIPASDTAWVTINTQSLTRLGEVRVTAASAYHQRWLRDFEERRAVGIAKFIDSSAVNRRNTVRASLFSATNLRSTRTGEIYFPKPCTPVVLIDWRPVPAAEVRGELDRLHVSRVAAIEIYEHKAGIPVSFATGRGVPDCLIAIWTKQMLP
jgi:hypothetical protein